MEMSHHQRPVALDIHLSKVYVMAEEKNRDLIAFAQKLWPKLTKKNNSRQKKSQNPEYELMGGAEKYTSEQLLLSYLTSADLGRNKRESRKFSPGPLKTCQTWAKDCETTKYELRQNIAP